MHSILGPKKCLHFFGFHFFLYFLSINFISFLSHKCRFGGGCMRVGEVMHHAVYVPSSVAVAAAVRVMERENIDSVLVRHGSTIGILTEHDVLRKVVARNLDASHVLAADIMSLPLHTIGRDDPVEEASDLMVKHRIRRLVVVENSLIVGVISAACIAQNIRYLAASRLISSESTLGEFAG